MVLTLSPMPLGTSLYTAFVFDLDGTLVDSRPAIEKAAQIAIEQVVPACRGRIVTPMIGPPIRQMFKTVMGEIDDPTLDRLVAVFRQAYNSGICRESPAYPGVPELLAQIAAHGATSFVLTNKPKVPTILLLQHLGVWHQIRETVNPDSSQDPFTSKTQALAALMQRHNLQQTHTLMVGDSADDAEAAHACKIAFAAAAYGYGRWDKQLMGNDYTIINSPNELLALLE
jgi:phosphoglycolate phosphatase